MAIQFRTYDNDTRFGADYYKLRNFLIKLDSHNYHFGRWDWMITHGNLDADALPLIGLWEDNGSLVATATFDCRLGRAYLLTLDGYQHLKADVLSYAKDALAENGRVMVMIADDDSALQDIAARQGFTPTQEKEHDAVYPIGDLSDIRYHLPDGFNVVSMREGYDLFKYGQVLWKGFGHEADGEGPFVWKEEDRPLWELGFKRPHVNLDIKIAVTAPNGEFASYCGMWHDPESQSALVEPVATDLAYRKMGLGRAAVLEGILRCGRLGAKRAYVGSSQQFYYQIGFKPYATATFWTCG